MIPVFYLLEDETVEDNEENNWNEVIEKKVDAHDVDERVIIVQSQLCRSYHIITNFLSIIFIVIIHCVQFKKPDEVEGYSDDKNEDYEALDIEDPLTAALESGKQIDAKCNNGINRPSKKDTCKW